MDSLILDSMRLEARLLRPVRSIGAEYGLRSLLFFGVAPLMSWVLLVWTYCVRFWPQGRYRPRGLD